MVMFIVLLKCCQTKSKFLPYMFSSIKRILKDLKSDILKQKVRGRFVSKSLSKHSLILLTLSLLSFILGCVMTHTYSNLYEVKIDYDESTTIPVYLPGSTIYFYIQIDDFYQTNLKYSKSISYDQLMGNKNTKSNVTEPLSSKNGKDYYPAGILPNTFFSDKFKLNNIDIDDSDISWNSMRKKIKPSGYTRDEVLSPPLWEIYEDIPDLSKNERFINWIYIAPFYNFRKLWGIIEVEEEGMYDMDIESTYPYGKKSVFFSQMSWVGTKNYFLSTSLIVMGVIGLLFTCLLYRKVLD